MQAPEGEADASDKRANTEANKEKDKGRGNSISSYCIAL